MTDNASSRPTVHRTPSRALERLYAFLPRVVQHPIVSMAGLRVHRERYGGVFSEQLREYAALEFASRDEVAGKRRTRLRALLQHAYREIPYWTSALRAADIDPARVQDPEDLKNLAPLTKDDVVRLGGALKWGRAPRSIVREKHTSGSTGAGLSFLTTIDAIRDQWAIWWRYRASHGIALDTWAAIFLGRPIVPGKMEDDRPWRVNWPGRELMFSQYHLRPANIRNCLTELIRRDIPWYHGYPSTLAYVASMALDAGVRALPRPRTITLAAESVFETQKTLVAEAFGAVPRSHYGMAEMVANVSECPAGTLHVDEDYSAVEFLPIGDGQYRILGTSLMNTAMPFIRYDTGDIARLDAAGCSCGRPGRVVAAIDGRQEDFLELADGSRVGRLDHLFKDAVRVAEAQIQQAVPGRCRILVVPRSGFGEFDRSVILAECRNRFGDRLEVEFAVTDKIPRTARGKLRLVVRNVGGIDGTH